MISSSQINYLYPDQNKKPQDEDIYFQIATVKKYVKILNIFAGPVCEAKLEGLREGQAYEWQVRAVNKASINSGGHKEMSSIMADQ
jgi:hypothetical protein